MTAPYTHNMPETATYWAPGANDGFGNVAFAAPAAIACRWQDKATLFRTPAGEERTSESVVYVASDVAIRGKLARGTFTEADPVAAAREIRQNQKSPAIDNGSELIKVFL